MCNMGAEIRTSDKARMFINTIPINQEFKASEIGEGINTKVYDLGSLFSILIKKGYLERVRFVKNTKGGRCAIYKRLKEAPIFMKGGSMNKGAKQIVIDYIKTLTHDFTMPMLIYTLGLSKSIVYSAIKEMMECQDVIKTGKLTDTSGPTKQKSAYYTYIKFNETPNFMDSFIFGGNPEIIRDNLYY